MLNIRKVLEIKRRKKNLVYFLQAISSILYLNQCVENSMVSRKPRYDAVPKTLTYIL